MNNFCPNCKSEIRSSLLSKEVSIMDESYTKLINEFSSNNSSAYCTKCYSKGFKEIGKKHEEELKKYYCHPTKFEIREFWLILLNLRRSFWFSKKTPSDVFENL